MLAVLSYCGISCQMNVKADWLAELSFILFFCLNSSLSVLGAFFYYSFFTHASQRQEDFIHIFLFRLAADPSK